MRCALPVSAAFHPGVTARLYESGGVGYAS